MSSLISGFTSGCAREVDVQRSEEQIVRMFYLKGTHTNLQEDSKSHGHCQFHILAYTQHRRVLHGSYCLFL